MPSRSVAATCSLGRQAPPGQRASARLRKAPACSSLLIWRSRRSALRGRALSGTDLRPAGTRCGRQPCNFLFFSSRALATALPILCALQRAIVNNNENTIAPSPPETGRCPERIESLGKNGAHGPGAPQHKGKKNNETTIEKQSGTRPHGTCA
jgi:hypothetical protein